MSEREFDVLVIGGGPAGSTTAAILRKYNPALRVLLVEQDAFPRHHIGESLVIETNRILADMGALERVAEAGFLKKGGATFVWGKDRTPWSLRFFEAGRFRPDPTGLYAHTWHVERSRYDKILLETAVDHGVETLHPGRVTDVLRDDSGRVTGAKVVDGAGAEHTIRARFTVDAGGRNGPLARRIGKRVFDKILRNVGVYGYWQGAELDPAYSLDWDLSLINVIAIPIGWIWYIPVRRGVTSVGVVTSHERYSNRTGSLEEFYLEHLRSSPEVAKWLAKAELIQLDHAPRKVLTEMDFNYQHDHVAGPGYALVGDAAGFVDPLFSIGVFLTQTAGQMLAYTLGSAFEDPTSEARLLASYDMHLRAQLRAFYAMAYVFYGFEESKEEWWQRTREIVRREALPDDIDDREAFMALTFGFGVNVTLFREAITCFGQMAAPQIRNALLGTKTANPMPLRDFDRVELPAEGARPRLRRAVTVTPSAIPVEGTGRMIAMSRVELAPLDGAKAAADFPRHLYLPDALVFLFERLDGSHTMASIRSEVEARLAGPESRRFFEYAVKSLRGLGALDLES